MHLFFLTISKPPCPLVPYVAGGSNSTRFLKQIIHSAFPSGLEAKLIYIFTIKVARSLKESINSIKSLILAFKETIIKSKIIVYVDL
jgi:hypothetical protein